MFWGSILSLGSPFQPFPTFSSGGWWFMALGDDFVVHLWRSISLLLVSYIPNLSVGHLLSQSIFSLLALLCLRLSLIRLSFGAGITYSRPFLVQGPSRRVYQLNPTDFATSLIQLHSFSKSRKFLFWAWWKSSVTQQLSISFSSFLDLTSNGHISLLCMLVSLCL